MKSLVALALLSLASALWGQATLLGDINSDPSSINSDAQYFVEFNGKVYFAAVQGDGISRLHMTDGTVAGSGVADPALLDVGNLCVVGGWLYFSARESVPGSNIQLWRSNGLPGGSSPVTSYAAHGVSQVYEVYPAGNRLFFWGGSGAGGRELWVSNGTAGGTSLAASLSAPSSFEDTHAFGNNLFFTYDDGTNGREPWFSDGTASGTYMLEDAYPGASDSNPAFGAVAGNLLYFAADFTSNDRDLWVTDGTAAGTQQLQTDPTDEGDPSSFCVLGTTLLFFAKGNGTGRELWRTDGTQATTTLVLDIYSGSGSSVGTGPTVILNGYAYFAPTNPIFGRELWRSDGTTAGTTLVTDLRSGANSGVPQSTSLASSGSRLFFRGDNGTADGLYVSDGTAGGTQILGPAGLIPGTIRAVVDVAYFRAAQTSTGTELWVSDAATATTTFLADINPGTASSVVHTPEGEPMPLLGTNYIGCFIVGGVVEVWVSDGTQGGTSALPLVTSTADSVPTKSWEVGGYALFRADNGTDGYELWRTDGTPGGTQMVVNLHPTANGWINADNAVMFGGQLYFGGSDSAGTGLFRTDGTSAGTVKLTTSFPLLGGMCAEMGGFLYFQGGAAFWRTDGTAANTQLVKDINPTGGANIQEMVASSSQVFISAQGPDGYELWVSDGTTAGTIQPLNINPTGDSTPFELHVIGNKVVFQADDGVNGKQIWVSDGTTAGTLPLTTLANPMSFQNFGVANGHVFFGFRDTSFNLSFWSTDGTPAGTTQLLNENVTYVTTVGSEVRFLAYGTGTTAVWKSDGTVAGTVQVLSLGTTGLASQSQEPTVVMGNLFFFPHWDTTAGLELWVSDGTAAGTFVLSDAWPGTPAGVSYLDLYPLAVSGGYVLFSAVSPGHMAELWITDGSVAGTRMLIEFAPGYLSGSPEYGGNFGADLLYWAYDVQAGVELWRVELGNEPRISLSQTQVTYTIGGGPQILDVCAEVVDLDSADFDTGFLQVQITANADADDRLTIANQGTGAGQIGVSGSNITYSGVVIGTFSGGVGATMLQVSFNASSTEAAVRALLRVIRFHSVSATPPTAARTIEFSMDDGDGNQSVPVSLLVALNAATAGSAVALVLTSQLGGATAGALFAGQPVVEARDAANQLDTSFVGMVTAAITAGPGATLQGTVTRQAVAGVATFTDLRIDLAGSGYVLTFTSGALTPATSSPFAVAAGTASTLVVSAAPIAATAGVAFSTQPSVEIQDSWGNLITTDNTTQVTAAIQGGTGATGAVLSGTLTVTASGGVVSFSGLSIDLAGTGYILDFSAGGLGSVSSSGFNVAPVGGGGGGGGSGGGGCSARDPAGIAWLGLLAGACLLARRGWRERLGA